LRSRQKKLDLFWELMKPGSGELVLNLGATPPHVGRALTGEQSDACIEQPEQDPRWESLRVIGLNISHENTRQYLEFYQRADRVALTADGCCLPFTDKSFDIVFSNAVMEHISSELQRRMASEIMRVGRSWFITTPNFWFPVEMHHRIPLFQFLPQPVQRAIQVCFHTWPESETIYLLSARRFQSLFPGSKLLKVRVTFWPESLLVFHCDSRNQSGAWSA